MPKAIRTDSRNNRTTGFAKPGLYSGRPGSLLQHVHDGDTVNVMLDGNLGVRFLGIDTPEISFAFPSQTDEVRFLSLNDTRWNQFLKTAMDEKRWGDFNPGLSTEMKSWLTVRIQGEPGEVHHEHAVKATDGLRKLIESDMKILGQDLDAFGYYMGFGFEVMDGYARLLCTINRNQPSRTEPTPRPPTYNLRMLERGFAFPYFIWPNISPWDRPDSIMDCVIPAGEAKARAAESRELQTARRLVREARQKHQGVFDSMNPLLLEPFELRMLSRRSIPSRYLIDLNSDSDQLIPPERYYEVPFSEDRLWIPKSYVPLFEKYGWKA